MVTQANQHTVFAPPSAQIYQRLKATLQEGKCAAVPTETVYGLLTRADDPAACAALYALKGRAFDKPLPVCVTSAAQAERLAQVCPLAHSLMKAFWPGPLTLVLPVKDTCGLAPQTLGPHGTVALRCPDCGWAEYLAANDFSAPLALTSANPSGAASPISAQDVTSALNMATIALVIDDGPCRAAQASTIIAIQNGRPSMLRNGALPRSAFDRIAMNWTDVA